jgi:hypothetical protein
MNREDQSRFIWSRTWLCRRRAKSHAPESRRWTAKAEKRMKMVSERHQSRQGVNQRYVAGTAASVVVFPSRNSAHHSASRAVPKTFKLNRLTPRSVECLRSPRSFVQHRAGECSAIHRSSTRRHTHSFKLIASRRKDESRSSAVQQCVGFDRQQASACWFAPRARGAGGTTQTLCREKNRSRCERKLNEASCQHAGRKCITRCRERGAGTRCRAGTRCLPERGAGPLPGTRCRAVGS